MRLLILTQKVDQNDPILGFFHRWVEEFSKHYEKITVICLEEGEHNLPSNVQVFSLGKEKKKSKINYVINFFRYIWQERNNYDAVFVHMNPEYVIFGGLFWGLWRKRIGLWYVHRAVNFRIWLAEKFANVIFTSAPESFRTKSSKVKYVGHGIDTDRFKFSEISDTGKVLHVGRITRIKNVDVIMRAMGDRKLSLVGEVVTEEDKKYKKELEGLVKNLNLEVEWLGAVLNSELPEIYKDHSFSINAAPDGGMDKAVLEALSAGVPTFVSNRAFQGVFEGYSELFMYEHKNSEDLKQKLNSWNTNDNKNEIMKNLSNNVSSKYSVGIVVNKITQNINV